MKYKRKRESSTDLPSPTRQRHASDTRQAGQHDSASPQGQHRASPSPNGAYDKGILQPQPYTDHAMSRAAAHNHRTSHMEAHQVKTQHRHDSPHEKASATVDRRMSTLVSSPYSSQRQGHHVAQHADCDVGAKACRDQLARTSSSEHQQPSRVTSLRQDAQADITAKSGVADDDDIRHGRGHDYWDDSAPHSARAVKSLPERLQQYDKSEAEDSEATNDDDSVSGSRPSNHDTQ